jgi:hypothetical protein
LQTAFLAGSFHGKDRASLNDAPFIFGSAAPDAGAVCTQGGKGEQAALGPLLRSVQLVRKRGSWCTPVKPV